MPIVSIVAPQRADSASVESIVKDVQEVGAVVLGCEKSNIWVHFQPTQAGYYLQNPDARPNPFVLIRANTGKPLESESDSLRLCSFRGSRRRRPIGKGLDSLSGNASSGHLVRRTLVIMKAAVVPHINGRWEVAKFRSLNLARTGAVKSTRADCVSQTFTRLAGQRRNFRGSGT